MKGYLHPRILPAETLPHSIMMSDISREICAEGPARTSKTIRNLQKLFAVHAKHKGTRSCIVRTNSVDLTDTIRWDIVNTLLRYQLDDPLSQIQQQGGVKFFHHLYLNDGEMRLGGMNRPGSILGGKYDIAMLSELSQFTEHQYQLLKTRVTGDNAKWVDKDGNPRFQIVADTNPDVPSHWMYQRESDGLIKFVKFDFKDNPYYFRKNRWSRVGKTSVDELDRSLTGVYHDRYFKGLRVAPADMVFNIQDCHITNTIPDLTTAMVYRCMDFGISAPNVCLWVAIDSQTRDITVFRDYRKIGQDIMEFGSQSINHTKEGIVDTVTDNDEHRQALLLKYCQMPTRLARKGPGSIMDGIQLIKQALRNTVEGLPGGIKFYSNMRVTSCPEIHRRKLPKDVIEEMRAYCMDENKDQPVKNGVEHGIDALRYWFLAMQEARMLGFATGVVPRRSRV